MVEALSGAGLPSLGPPIGAPALPPDPECNHWSLNDEDLVPHNLECMHLDPREQGLHLWGMAVSYLS